MSSSGYGQAPKKETVYSGPAPTPRQGTVYSGPSIQTGGGTVYSGPSVGGTVYGGPGAGTIASRPVAGSPSSEGSEAARNGGGVFYAIALLSAIRAIALYTGVEILKTSTPTNGPIPQSTLVIYLAVAGIFAVIGFFTQGGSKVAYMIGMLLYGLDTVALIAMNPASHVVGIVLHLFFLLALFVSYRKLP